MCFGSSGGRIRDLESQSREFESCPKYIQGYNSKTFTSSYVML